MCTDDVEWDLATVVDALNTPLAKLQFCIKTLLYEGDNQRYVAFVNMVWWLWWLLVFLVSCGDSGSGWRSAGGRRCVTRCDAADSSVRALQRCWWRRAMVLLADITYRTTPCRAKQFFKALVGSITYVHDLGVWLFCLALPHTAHTDHTAAPWPRTALYRCTVPPN